MSCVISAGQSSNRMANPNTNTNRFAAKRPVHAVTCREYIINEVYSNIVRRGFQTTQTHNTPTRLTILTRLRPALVRKMFSFTWLGNSDTEAIAPIKPQFPTEPWSPGIKGPSPKRATSGVKWIALIHLQSCKS